MRHHPTAAPPRRRRLHPSRVHRANGFALIEALIALLIFTLGALGLLGLQVSMMRATSSAKYRADAAYLANDLVGRMWADAANLAAYQTCTNTPCSSWKDKVGQTLPQGSATLSVTPGTGVVGITVSWVVPNEGSHSFRTTTAINR